MNAILLLLACITLVGCARSRLAREPVRPVGSFHAQPESAGEAAVIRHHFATRGMRQIPVVLSARSSIGTREPGHDEWQDRLRRSAAKHEGSIREAVEDYIAKNGADSDFEHLDLDGLRVIVVSEATLREVFRDLGDGWTIFRTKFGTSSNYSLSHVGFSRDGRTALYFAHVQRDWLNGEGEFHVLRKQGETWTRDAVSIGWIVHS